MLTPIQQTSGTMVSDLLRSVIDQTEERRLEEERKVKGKPREDDTTIAQKAGPKFGFAEARANEKIHSFFFGAQKADADPRATLISRFSSALGISQGSDEANFSFARRLGDALTLVERFDQTQDITLESLGVTQKDVTDVMNGTAPDGTKPSGNAKLAARYADKAGLTADDVNFTANLQGILTSARAKLPETVARLETSTGLEDLGMSAREMIQAIASPWSEAGLKLQAALDEKAEVNKEQTFETLKVIQRLEEAADPKTIEELKSERGTGKSGRVEDAETKAEREDTISQLEASDKLDDVRELQEAVREHQEGAVEAGPDGSVDSELVLVQALAATKPDSTDDVLQADGAAPVEEAPSADSAGQSDKAAIVSAAMDAQDNKTVAIFPVRVDDNGLYELLYGKAA